MGDERITLKLPRLTEPKAFRQTQPYHRHTAKCSDSDMLLSAKKEGGGGVIFMTSNDLVIPAGIRLRIPSLLVFPDQVSCGEKPKATVFPFCSRGAALRLMSISEEHEKKNVFFFFLDNME